MFWHELLSCAGSADRNGMLRICFIPQQGRSSALPSLFLAKLAKISGYTAESMWQLLLEFKSPAVENTLLYCMRRAFEGVWRALGTLDDDRAPQLAAPQWQLLQAEHVEATEVAVRHAAAAARAEARGGGSDGIDGSSSSISGGSADNGSAVGSSSSIAGGRYGSGGSEFAIFFVAALRHLCAYHDCALRDSVATYLMRHLSRPQPALDLSLLLRLPHTAPPPYVDHTARRPSALDGMGDTRLPTPKPAASIAEVRALAAALCCCGGVHAVQAIDVRLGEEAIVAFAEVLRFSNAMTALRLNHVTSNSNAARASMSTLVDMLPIARAPLMALDLAHNAHLEETSLLRLINALKGLPRGLTALQLDGCGFSARAAEALGAVLSEGSWPSSLHLLTLAHNTIGREEGSVALAAALRCSTALTTLDVTHTGMDMPTLFEALLSNEALLRGLTQLYLSGPSNKLSRNAAAQLAEFLSRCSALRQLGIARMQLLPESFEPIFGAALANSKLTELAVDASDNELGERCAKGLAEQLRRMGGAAASDGRSCGLCGLKMRSTSLTEGGVCTLLEPLAAQGQLLQLDLSANLRKKMVPWPSGNDDDLGHALVSLIKSCTSLRSLSLGAEQKDAGTVKCDLSGLPDALADHGSLTSVDVAAMRVDEQTLCAIANALTRNKSLLTLTLPSAAKTSEALAADATIRVVLDRNRSLAAERLQLQPGELLLVGSGSAGATAGRKSPSLRSGSGSLDSAVITMPSRSELFKEVERNAYLEVSQRLPEALPPFQVEEVNGSRPRSRSSDAGPPPPPEPAQPVQKLPVTLAQPSPLAAPVAATAAPAPATPLPPPAAASRPRPHRRSRSKHRRSSSQRRHRQRYLLSPIKSWRRSLRWLARRLTLCHQRHSRHRRPHQLQRPLQPRHPRRRRRRQRRPRRQPRRRRRQRRRKRRPRRRRRPLQRRRRRRQQRPRPRRRRRQRRPRRRRRRPRPLHLRPRHQLCLRHPRQLQLPPPPLLRLSRSFLRRLNQLRGTRRWLPRRHLRKPRPLLPPPPPLPP